MDLNEFKVMTLCGSMRFYEQMLEVAEFNSRLGYIVLMPHVRIAPEEQVESDLKKILDQMHFVKIDMADEVWVVSDESEYIGESTKREIGYAERQGKYKGVIAVDPSKYDD